MKIGFKLLRSNAKLPSYGDDDSSNMGIDLYACLNNIIVLEAGQYCTISTGVAWEPLDVCPGCRGGLIIKSRSSMGVKNSIECSNAGVIDDKYRGEIFIKLYNNSNSHYVISNGDRIAQAVALETPRYEIVELEYLTETTRGINGLGSTGK
jgi:dUTP pyrophosphatase